MLLPVNVNFLSNTRKATSGVFDVPGMMRSSMGADVRMGKKRSIQK